MFSYALKILLGDRSKYIGMILGLTFASFIIIQQAAIFIGLMTRTYGFITDTNQASIWVMDGQVRYVDDIKPLNITELLRVRGIEGVDWAVPLFKGLVRARQLEGEFQVVNLIGIDNSSLIGEPPKMLTGKVEDLRMTDAIIVSKEGAENQLAKRDPKTGKKRSLQVGDTLELNDNRAVVVGIADVSRTFQTQPVIYTTYRRALRFVPFERNNLSYILVQNNPSIQAEKLCERITKITGFGAYTPKQFKSLTINYFLKRTGIPINFGVAIGLGFIIGIAIAGQTFYNFTLDNLRYFGTFKAMGADNFVLTQMILLQSFVVGTIGWGLGVGAASTFGLISAGSQLSFRMPWQLYTGSYFAMMFICLLAAYISIKKVIRLEPSIVFKS